MEAVCGGKPGQRARSTMAPLARPMTAARIFRERAHDRVHELAQVVDFSSRAVAGRLLEANAVVERDLASPQDGPRLAADLRQLVPAGRGALVAMTVTPPPCA